MISQAIHRGFTLIETVVYLALFSILMGGAVLSAYHLFDAATKVGTRMMLQEEEDFVLGKIDWVLSDTKSVITPNNGATSSSLTVARWNTTNGDPMTIAKNEHTVTLVRGTGAPVVLNNTNTTVTSLIFSHQEGSGDGIVPEAIQTVLSLSAHAPTGEQVLRTATSTFYLRH